MTRPRHINSSSRSQCAHTVLWTLECAEKRLINISGAVLSGGWIGDTISRSGPSRQLLAPALQVIE